MCIKPLVLLKHVNACYVGSIFYQLKIYFKSERSLRVEEFYNVPHEVNKHYFYLPSKFKNGLDRKSVV
jgi:hypothetical protein